MMTFTSNVSNQLITIAFIKEFPRTWQKRRKPKILLAGNTEQPDLGGQILHQFCKLLKRFVAIFMTRFSLSTKTLLRADIDLS